MSGDKRYIQKSFSNVIRSGYQDFFEWLLSIICGMQCVLQQKICLVHHGHSHIYSDTNQFDNFEFSMESGGDDGAGMDAIMF